MPSPPDEADCSIPCHLGTCEDVYEVDCVTIFETLGCACGNCCDEPIPPPQPRPPPMPPYLPPGEYVGPPGGNELMVAAVVTLPLVCCTALACLALYRHLFSIGSKTDEGPLMKRVQRSASLGRASEPRAPRSPRVTHGARACRPSDVARARAQCNRWPASTMGVRRRG